MNDLFKTFENWLRGLVAEINQQQIAALTERVEKQEEALRIANLGNIDPVVISQLVSEAVDEIDWEQKLDSAIGSAVDNAIDDIDWSDKVDAEDAVRSVIENISWSDELGDDIEHTVDRAVERAIEDIDWSQAINDNFDFGGYYFRDSVAEIVRETLKETSFTVKVEG